MSKHEVMLDKIAELSGLTRQEVEARIKDVTGGKSVSKLRRPSMNRAQRRRLESKERVV